MIPSRPVTPSFSAALGSGQRALFTVLLILAALVVSIGVGLSNSAYFEALDRLFQLPASRVLLRGILFSSYLLLLSLPFVLWRPRVVPLGIGDTVQQGWLVLGVVAGYALFTAAAVAFIGGTPYSGLDFANVMKEVLIVPVTEELFFRGVLLSGVLAGMRSLYAESLAIPLAIVTGAVAFGVAHFGNFFAASISLAFVLPQVIFASLLGVGAGYLMVRTRSLYPAILLHAVVNLVAILF